MKIVIIDKGSKLKIVVKQQKKKQRLKKVLQLIMQVLISLAPFIFSIYLS